MRRFRWKLHLIGKILRGRPVAYRIETEGTLVIPRHGSAIGCTSRPATDEAVGIRIKWPPNQVAPRRFAVMRLPFLNHKHLTLRGRENVALVVLAGACIALMFVVRHV